MQEGRPAAGSSVAPPAVEAPPPEAEAWPAWPAVEGVASSGSLAPPVPPASDVAEQDPEHFWNAQVDHDAFWNAQSPNFEHWQALHGFTTAAAMASQHADSGKQSRATAASWKQCVPPWPPWLGSADGIGSHSLPWKIDKAMSSGRLNI